ncbi:MAG: late competence development ComFB family protein [Alkalispirochaeta sp.]
MEIHNLMEDLVHSTVAELCRDDDQGDHRYCTSAQCQTDAVCYVLNRVPPRYVSSGRGLAHLTSDLRNDQQLMIDLVRLAHEGLHRVSAVRRGYYDSASGTRIPGICFNFPTIKGRILDGTAFMPVSDVDVELLHHDTLVEMFDERWSNPYRISDRTPGTFTFWPAPVEASTPGETRSFDFQLAVHAPGYYELSHHFTVELTSDDRETQGFSLGRDHQLPDLYLFPV